MNDKNTIDILYGESSTQSSTLPIDELNISASEEEIKDLYPESDESIQGNPYVLPEDRDSIENELYGENECVELSSETDLSIIYSDPEEQNTLRKNLGHIASSSGASQADVESLVETCNEHILTNAEYAPDTVMSELYEQHGKELNQKLHAAQQLVASYPDLSAWLDETQAGNNPHVINQIMKISQLPRSEVRLQKLNNLKQGIK